ncbi:hypothetical protein [Burkholderia sp. IMCC1007]|uniref:hypothetical protein n=1 Tax=Burkholderia sp. IMCC1007 TaxID=3004104 RepID=UPI0022B4E07D|nr:hypothetical protein [Burkholderia sp. IMCC1007]
MAATADAATGTIGRCATAGSAAGDAGAPGVLPAAPDDAAPLVGKDAEVEAVEVEAEVEVEVEVEAATAVAPDRLADAAPVVSGVCAAEERLICIVSVRRESATRIG